MFDNHCFNAFSFNVTFKNKMLSCAHTSYQNVDRSSILPDHSSAHSLQQPGAKIGPKLIQSHETESVSSAEINVGLSF